MANHISIVIPVYNSQQYLPEAVNSALEMSDYLCDIVLVDDGSTDDSGAICDQLQRENDRIKVIHQNNSGQHKSRLNGACRAAGDYVMFLDSDDYYVDFPLPELNGIIETISPDMILFHMSYSPNGDKAIHTYSLPEGLLDAEGMSYVKELLLTTDRLNHLCTKVYKRSVVIEQFGKTINDNIRIGEDLIQNLYIFSNISRIYYIPKIFYYYRQQESSITHTHPFDYLEAEYVYRCRVETMHAWNKTELAPTINRNFIKKVSYSMINSIPNGPQCMRRSIGAIKASHCFEECYYAVKKSVSIKTRAVIFLVKHTPWFIAYSVLKIAGICLGA